MSHLPGCRARRRATAALALIGLGLSACGGGGSDATGDRYEPMLDALCQAAEAEDRSTAELAFFQGAHAELHELAVEVRDVAPDVAGGLLIVKSRVENLVRNQDAELPTITDAVIELVAVTRDALDRVDRPAPTC